MTFSAVMASNVVGAVDDDLARDLAADRVDLALEVADAGFARVALDHHLHRIVRKMMFLSVRPEPSTALATRKRLAISTFSCSV